MYTYIYIYNHYSNTHKGIGLHRKYSTYILVSVISSCGDVCLCSISSVSRKLSHCEHPAIFQPCTRFNLDVFNYLLSYHAISIQF